MRKLLSLLSVLVLACIATPVLAQSATPVVRQNPYSMSDGTVTSPITDQFGRLWTAPAAAVPYANIPSPNSTSFPLVKTSAVASSLVIAGGGNVQLYYLNVVSGASAGFVMVFPGASAPADGAVTPSLCFNLAANSTFVMPVSERFWFSGGVTAVFSTTGCFTKTASATAFISGVAL